MIHFLFNIFFVFSSTANIPDLEAQREVSLNMLFKLVVYPEALRTIMLILHCIRREGEEKWRKVSRMTVDVLLPLLANQKIKITSKSTIDLLLRVFAALSPGCLRPVDPLLNNVLTCAVDLNNLEDLQCWLGFIVLSLPILTNQSPEEGAFSVLFSCTFFYSCLHLITGILCRLEELGIQIGSGTHHQRLLDTSMESSTSTNSESTFGMSFATSTSPEETFAKFLIQVIGAACNQLHQLCYSQTMHFKDTRLLRQELSHLLLFVIFMFQSGRYVRVARAAQILARNKDEVELMYNIATITELFLDLAHEAPYLSLQWLYILNLLDHSPSSLWSQVLGVPNRPEEEAQMKRIGFNSQILRKGGLILYCDFLCDHTSNVDHTAWLVVNNVHLLMENHKESPVQDFIMSMHRSQSSSGLLLEVLSVLVMISLVRFKIYLFFRPSCRNANSSQVMSNFSESV